MRILGLDIGLRRTGVAFADSTDDILFSLETIQHKSEEELIEAIQNIVAEKSIEEVVLGLPLLLSGEEGSQAKIVVNIQEKLKNEGISCSVLDERYTTPKAGDMDKDAASACEILALWLQRK
ncbi:MAG: Holliday junction resolvase RuvX [Candidatus Peribacter sp.]|jgi:putative holliday junction resolvase|nr:Holliday junction resolvase RuvX [Candidatus Peribacter sp.]MBT4392495.1 Holliday junction resolvase RuvX [Candidatus Peribacter sp.]MBT4601324.1 Holliday junction resolvase RuvX [Candidatus Peribacter sp.]MBT5149224.1 Holliday junction resolvase RuvX [Candidatus Peribacter sp.]MBT5638050.1 Holliday junction resolvase RuvX [Candidatus Peribacter sp.]